MTRIIAIIVSAALLSACAMSPERQQALARALSNYHPYYLPPVKQQPIQPVQQPHQSYTTCTPIGDQVSCTTNSY